MRLKREINEFTYNIKSHCVSVRIDQVVYDDNNNEILRKDADAACFSPLDLDKLKEFINKEYGPEIDFVAFYWTDSVKDNYLKRIKPEESD